MKISLYEGNSAINIEEIEKVESELNISFPLEYREFLLNQNGGYPNLTVFSLPDGTDTSAISEFYPIGNMKTNLLKCNKYFNYDKNFITIADDQGGNQILLRVKGDNIGEIHFFYHDVDPEEENPMHFLANSLNDFLKNLKEDE